LVEAIYRELQLEKAERVELEATVLTLMSAVTGLMQRVAAGVGLGSPIPGGVDLSALELRFKTQEEAVNGRLDSIRQDIGGVNFTEKEAAMGWAHLHLPPGSYQCIGGMIYAMCLISEAIVHQEDMMKREEHGEWVKRTFMQSAQVLSVHTSYPLVLDGDKGASKRDSSVDFLELHAYKQWKPTDGDGTLKKLEEGVERSFDLIDNAIESTFAINPQARTVLLELVREFKSLFHSLFVMEVNRSYEDTLNKVVGEHPGEPTKVQCWALVTKLLKTVFKCTAKARNFATEAGGPDMDPLTTNGYFLYAALEELRVLRLDAQPNPVLRLNGVDEQIKAVRASVDHMQMNLGQIRVHTNMAAMRPLAKKAKVGEID